MLVLARKKGEVIQLGEEVLIKIIEVSGDTVRIGIEAPENVSIVRGELLEEVTELNKSSIPKDLSGIFKV